MKSISKVTSVVSKVFEVIHWVAAIAMIVVLAGSAASAGWLSGIIETVASGQNATLSAYGFEVMVADGAGNINMTLVLLFSIGTFIILGFVAMVFRNIYLIIKKSQNATPFQKDNVRMLREIGIFSIAVPVIGLIMSIVIRLVVNVDAVETSVNLGGFVIGIAVLCLTQFFAHGLKLEADVDGLL